MIDSILNVTVEVGGREWKLRLTGEKGKDRWEVAVESGRQIGLVYKSSYTYSPPTHRGSRIARYHKQVPCWRGDSGPVDDRERGIDRKTRKAALEEIVREYMRRNKVQEQMREWARAHPEASFRLNRGPNALGHGHRGEVIHPHQPDAIVVRDKSKKTGSRDVKVRLRELERDTTPCLEVQLAKGRRFEPIVNPLYDEFGSSYVGG